MWPAEKSVLAIYRGKNHKIKPTIQKRRLRSNTVTETTERMPISRIKRRIETTANADNAYMVSLPTLRIYTEVELARHAFLNHAVSMRFTDLKRWRFLDKECWSSAPSGVCQKMSASQKTPAKKAISAYEAQQSRKYLAEHLAEHVGKPANELFRHLAKENRALLIDAINTSMDLPWRNTSISGMSNDVRDYTLVKDGDSFMFKLNQQHLQYLRVLDTHNRIPRRSHITRSDRVFTELSIHEHIQQAKEYGYDLVILGSAPPGQLGWIFADSDELCTYLEKNTKITRFKCPYIAYLNVMKPEDFTVPMAKGLLPNCTVFDAPLIDSMGFNMTTVTFELTDSIELSQVDTTSLRMWTPNFLCEMDAQRAEQARREQARREQEDEEDEEDEAPNSRSLEHMYTRDAYNYRDEQVLFNEHLLHDAESLKALNLNWTNNEYYEEYDEMQPGVYDPPRSFYTWLYFTDTGQEMLFAMQGAHEKGQQERTAAEADEDEEMMSQVKVVATLDYKEHMCNLGESEIPVISGYIELVDKEFPELFTTLLGDDEDSLYNFFHGKLPYHPSNPTEEGVWKDLETGINQGMRGYRRDLVATADGEVLAGSKLLFWGLRVYRGDVDLLVKYLKHSIRQLLLKDLRLGLDIIVSDPTKLRNGYIELEFKTAPDVAWSGQGRRRRGVRADHAH